MIDKFAGLQVPDVGYSIPLELPVWFTLSDGSILDSSSTVCFSDERTLLSARKLSLVPRSASIDPYGLG